MNEKEKMKLDSQLIGYVPKRYLTQKDAATYTGTSPNTIKKYTEMGLPQIIFEEKSNPKYDIKDIDAFMAKYKNKGSMRV